MQPRNIREPPLTGGKAIKYIPILNGDDNIGVEDFVADVRAIRNVCTQKALLLKAIKIEKIIGQAAQGIRNIRIENYTNLFDAFRQNVAAQVTSDEYAEQLRELRQGRDESVQSFNISFRQATVDTKNNTRESNEGSKPDISERTTHRGRTNVNAE
jgi:hypothetical protein